MKKLLFLFLLLHSHLYTMNNPTAELLYDTLVDKVSSLFGQAHNRIFYFKVKNKDNVYNEFYNGTHHAIEELKNSNVMKNNDFIFFDPRCDKSPLETSRSLGWQQRDEKYPQLHDDFKLIIYNIPDIDEISDHFITLLEKNIKHQKNATKNNIVLNINSNLQQDPKVLQLQELLGRCIIVSGDLNTELTSINF